MKQTALLITALFAFSFALLAQITQEKADEIVLERMSEETQPHTVFAKAEMQADGKTITTSTGKQIELDYSCWVYFIQFADAEQSFYLIVNADNGNLLQINTINAEEPDDLAEWRKVDRESEVTFPREIPFEEFSLAGSSCGWRRFEFSYTPGVRHESALVIINSNEGLKKHIQCTREDFPEIDFSKYTLLLAHGAVTNRAIIYYTSLQQLSAQQLIMQIDLTPSAAPSFTFWQVPIVINRVPNNFNVELVVTLDGGFPF